MNPFNEQNSASNQSATPEPVLSLAVKIALGKAAILIREVMDLDGVGFLDAVPRGFASCSAHKTPTEIGNPFLNDSQIEPDGFEDDNSPKRTALARSLRYQPDPSLTATGRSPTETGVSMSSLSEIILQRLIQTYPRGHLFSADEYGPIDDHFCPGNKINTMESRRGQRKCSTHNLDATELFRVRPETRFLIFLRL